MAKLLGKCPWCLGNLYDDHGTIKCLQCSREVNGNGSRRLYYAANKETILKTLDQTNRRTTMERFMIPSTSMHALLRRWGRLNGPKPAPVRDPVTNIMLPGLPAFSNDWPAEVQIKWLEVWAERSK